MAINDRGSILWTIWSWNFHPKNGFLIGWMKLNVGKPFNFSEPVYWFIMCEWIYAQAGERCLKFSVAKAHDIKTALSLALAYLQIPILSLWGKWSHGQSHWPLAPQMSTDQHRCLTENTRHREPFPSSLQLPPSAPRSCVLWWPWPLASPTSLGVTLSKGWVRMEWASHPSLLL